MSLLILFTLIFNIKFVDSYLLFNNQENENSEYNFIYNSGLIEFNNDNDIVEFDEDIYDIDIFEDYKNNNFKVNIFVNNDIMKQLNIYDKQLIEYNLHFNSIDICRNILESVSDFIYDTNNNSYVYFKSVDYENSCLVNDYNYNKRFYY